MRLARPSTPYANTTIAVLVAKVESKSFAEVKAGANPCDRDSAKIKLNVANTFSALHLLWRERGNNFFEARVAAQRVPARMQTQFAVAQIAGGAGRDS
jgi:hypothetical protein